MKDEILEIVSGFTVIEWLIVIAILAIVLMLSHQGCLPPEISEDDEHVELQKEVEYYELKEMIREIIIDVLNEDKR